MDPRGLPTPVWEVVSSNHCSRGFGQSVSFWEDTDLKTQNHLYVSLQDTHCSCWHDKGMSESWPCAGLTSVDVHLISWMHLSLFYQKPLYYPELLTPALVCWSIKTKYHRMGVNQIFSHHSGGVESKTKVSVGGFPWTFLLGIWKAPSCFFLLFALCTHIPYSSSCVQISPYKDTSHTSLGSTQMPNLSITSLKCLPSNNSHVLVTGSWDFHMRIQARGRHNPAQSSTSSSGSRWLLPNRLTSIPSASLGWEIQRIRRERENGLYFTLGKLL